MDIEQSNWANRSSIADVREYFGLDEDELMPLYEELLADTELVDLANEQFGIGRDAHFGRLDERDGFNPATNANVHIVDELQISFSRISHTHP